MVIFVLLLCFLLSQTIDFAVDVLAAIVIVVAVVFVAVVIFVVVVVVLVIVADSLVKSAGTNIMMFEKMVIFTRIAEMYAQKSTMAIVLYEKRRSQKSPKIASD
jgi:hypothetical protein